MPVPYKNGLLIDGGIASLVPVRFISPLDKQERDRLQVVTTSAMGRGCVKTHLRSMQLETRPLRSLCIQRSTLREYQTDPREREVFEFSHSLGRKRTSYFRWPLLILPRFDGHTKRSKLLRKGVFNGTQTSQAVHA